MATTSIRIPDKLQGLFDDYLKTTGRSLSGFAVEAMLEKIEEDMDLRAYNEAVDYNAGKGTITLAEMEQELLS